jgi:hypothetical protein
MEKKEQIRRRRGGEEKAKKITGKRATATSSVAPSAARPLG